MGLLKSSLHARGQGSCMGFPDFLEGVVSESAYRRWLRHKARAHARRDRGRGYTCAVPHYKNEIHKAVCASAGKDVYTGELLDWRLISTYDNAESKAGRHKYKATFALLPTVDHFLADATSVSFRICAWRTNDAKHDLALRDFLTLCRSVLEHAGYTVTPPSNPAR
ncbi:hypothetical protein [Tahibacter amnicola]|uniref:Uncharacterized protein n=1 Tax=Tahibacter amnicola TaxID=2976241 RepID=A0ABY6B8F1_9GAMM|nr:hypothetical protein [Tahibacter amnicola]UXI65949.1 hypothetical protein N4264_14415 [Tahibacter amnicola]